MISIPIFAFLIYYILIVVLLAKMVNAIERDNNLGFAIIIGLFWPIVLPGFVLYYIGRVISKLITNEE